MDSRDFLIPLRTSIRCARRAVVALAIPATMALATLGILTGCQGEDESSKKSAAARAADSDRTPLPPGANNPGLPGNPPPTPAPSAVPPTASPSPTPQFVLRVGYRKGVAGLAGVLAGQTRWFERYGVGLQELPPLLDSTAALDSMALGNADVLYGISIPALLDANRRVPGAFRIIGFTVETTDSLSGSVLVPKDSPVKTVEELRGKRIAATGADFAVSAASLLFNVDHDTTIGLARGATRNRVIDLDFPSNLPRPRFDALYATEAEWARQTLPLSPAATSTGTEAPLALRPLARVSLAQKFGAPFPVTAVVLREELLRTEPERMAVFLRANNDLMRWCVTNGPEALPSLQKMLALDDEAALNLNLPRTASIHEVPPAVIDRAAAIWGRYAPGGPVADAKLSALYARLPAVFQKLEPTPVPPGATIVAPAGARVLSAPKPGSPAAR